MVLLTVPIENQEYYEWLKEDYYNECVENEENEKKSKYYEYSEEEVEEY
jgi:hypothetical protein